LFMAQTKWHKEKSLTLSEVEGRTAEIQRVMPITPP
jgi:hypothetical protein